MTLYLQNLVQVNAVHANKLNEEKYWSKMVSSNHSL